MSFRRSLPHLSFRLVPHLIPQAVGALALAAGLASTAHAADDPTAAVAASLDSPGPYLGIGLGVSKLGPHDDGHGDGHGDGPGAAKLYGGYRLTDTWGVEAGWAHLGHVQEDSTAADGSTVRHRGDASSLYLAGTGRIALGAGFSLTGKAGLSFGHVGARDADGGDFTLGGSRASPLLGIGAEYRLNRHLALSFDLDAYGKVSDKVKAGAATVGLRYGF